MSSSGDFSVRVEGLSKRYVVPRRHDSAGRRGRVAAHLREFFPFLGRAEQDYFWALRDLSFEVKSGEILGILGRNGSGKSTLLKILSAVTQPTAGRALLRGRVGSLLEVGTGFHPDLTGRENVFMSGVLLGLKRHEIAAKFDEIVDFSGIEPFIDVPVKRYSSGMYVRLAYAVASLLRSDILILDEVMAVGDAEFTKKTQANIDRVASEGRTILFVSHSVQTVLNICQQGLVLSSGRVTYQGTARDCVSEYMRVIHHIQPHDESAPALIDLSKAQRVEGHASYVIKSVSTQKIDGTPSRTFQTGEGVRIRVGFDAGTEASPYFCLMFLNMSGDRVMTLYSTHTVSRLRLAGEGVVECVVPELRLVTGEYSVLIDFGRVGRSMQSLDCIPNATSILVRLGTYLGEPGILANQGWFAQKSAWTLLSREAQ